MQVAGRSGNIESEAGGIAWQLFQVDESGRPTAMMAGLAESVLETDHSGREMRPT